MHFKPSNVCVKVCNRANLMEIARKAGVWIDAMCGGTGKCGKCAVKISADGKTQVQLACRFEITQNIEVEIPKAAFSQTAEKAAGRTVQVILPAEIGKIGIDKPYVMAFDVGTTTVVGYLLDGTSGAQISVVSRMNPQTQYGADVIKRAEYFIEHGGSTISRIIRAEVDDMIGAAVQEAGIKKEQIVLIMLAGNTCMHHLFMGLPVQELVTAPYKPAVKKSMVQKAEDCGIGTGGKLIWLPNIDGFVGSDTVAALLAIEIDNIEKSVLMLDMGTNGEIAVGNKNRYVVCSTAAGPAFEGANISCGMRGIEGAIEKVEVTDNGIELKVIGRGKPVGLCGSGLLDAVACMVKCGIIDETGKMAEETDNFLPDFIRERIIGKGAERRFVLAWNNESANDEVIAITQKDVREVQLAKAAIAAGIKTLLQEFGIGFDDLDRVMLAGAFGNYASPKSVCTLGILPSGCESKIVQIGNAAGEGAVLAAINYNEYKRALQIAENAEFLELAASEYFRETFIEEMMFDCGEK